MDEARLDMSRGHTKPFLKQEQLCFNTLNLLHMESVNSASVKSRVLLVGDGRRYMKNGESSGQPVHQLKRAVNNSPSVDANQGAVEHSGGSSESDRDAMSIAVTYGTGQQKD